MLLVTTSKYLSGTKRLGSCMSVHENFELPFHSRCFKESRLYMTPTRAAGRHTCTFMLLIIATAIACLVIWWTECESSI